MPTDRGMCKNAHFIQSERKTMTEKRDPSYEELQQKLREVESNLASCRYAEQALQESEKKYSTLVENSLTGIYIDQGDKIVFANDQFAQIYGYTKDEVLGMENWRLVHPEDRKLTDEMREKRLKGQNAPREYEARGLMKDGSAIWVRRRNTRIDYEGRPAVLGNIVDITEDKQTREELKRAKEELEIFLNMMSHDLKTPIIAIQGFSHRLLERCDHELENAAREYLEQIVRNAGRVSSMVADALNFSKAGREVLNHKEIPSLQIVRDIVAGLKMKLEENNTSVVVKDNLPVILADEEKIRRVFQNLLANAAKFTQKADEPMIEIGYKDAGACHQFFVRDNGVGIDEKDQDCVFEAFHRLNRIEDEEGSGLGLAIVDRAVRAHGGEVWVESEEDEGATFYFTLPKHPNL